MINNNSYFGTTPFNNSYVPYNSNLNQFQNSTYIPRQQQTQQYTDVPFLFVGYGTLDEAKPYIVPPTKAVMFIDKVKNEFYIKSCDNTGNPSLETFKFTRVTDNPSEEVSSQIDTKEFVTKQDLSLLPTKEDLKGFLTVENTKDFVTKSDFKILTNKLDQLQKQIKINEILKEENSEK